MITLEDYASVYLAMITATGNAAQQQKICEGRGFSPAEWTQAQAHYTAQMSQPSDMGRTAMAFAQAMANPKTVAQAPKTGDFTATKVDIDVSEFEVQMINFIGVGRHLLFQRGLEFDQSAESFNGNTFHISLDDQSQSIYGGLQSATLGRDRLTLVFDAEGAARMKTPQLTILFAIDEKKWAFLARKLKFVLNPLPLKVAAFTPSAQVQVGDLLLDQTRVAAKVDDMHVRIRTNLHNLKDSQRFETMVNLKFDGIFDDAESALVDEFEHDLGAVFAFDTTTNGKRTFYVYSALDQDGFMSRINYALRGLPRLPLEIGGGADAEWNNYAACLADVKS